MSSGGERRYLFTSESVTEGHPDKVCDQISDGVLDAIYEQDPYARVACETALSPGLVFLMGEITTSAKVDVAQVARRVIEEIGYVHPEYGLDARSCAVLTAINQQSPDIARGVDRALEAEGGDPYDRVGAGDQGLMFGYACRETPELMPLPIALAHRLARRLAQVRKEGILPYLRPDGKTQVTVEYRGYEVVRLDTIVVSTQHAPDVEAEQIHRDVVREVVLPVVPEELIDDRTRYLVNPTGRFVVGGPAADAGLTGRKIIADTYGGMGRHGGGAFSGKDPTKVDRSGAYAARYVAKNIVAAGLADRCEVQVAYAIGVARPVSFSVDTFGTGVVDDDTLSAVVREVFDLRPAAIIEQLQLRRPIYRQVAAYGHFGRTDLDLPWERTDKVEDLKRRIAGLNLVR
ncbi:MAG TPA: methionine adenosyltransferase [Limnochordia bacterium]|nr:methionine adenosyltransferase [Limnochordia bacterium]